MYPCSAMSSSTRLRRSLASSGSVVGAYWVGNLGSAASKAESCRLSSEACLWKYVIAAASTP